MLKLPSNLRSINVLDSFVQDVVHQYKISQEVHGNMLISLTEAVTNAITHGNHYDENKKNRRRALGQLVCRWTERFHSRTKTYSYG